MKFEYYFNDVPGQGLQRNNLIYTSLMSTDKKTFVQWYYNDTEYHAGQNEVVDSSLMQEKFDREVKYLQLMSNEHCQHVPEICDIDFNNRKIYLKVDGKDFWNRSNCSIENYNTTVPDWQEQVIEILKAHKSLGLHKYSMHPSSYFVVDGKLKSINYFFTYHKTEPNISVKDVQSHIYSTRQKEMQKYLNTLGIEWDSPQSWDLMDKLCWNSFRTNYPSDFIEKCIGI